MQRIPIFVYGSLKAQAERDLFSKLQRTVKPAKIQGATMYDLGSFPGIKLNGTGTVVGELHHYHVREQYRQILGLMDKIEGFHGKKSDLYTRVKVSVTKDSGEVVEAFTYIFNGSVHEADIISTGEWTK